MKHIVIISAVFPPEPVTTSYLNYDLAMELSKEYKVTVIRPKPSRPKGRVYQREEYEVEYPFECKTVSSYTFPESKLFGRMREAISFSIECRKYLKKNKNSISFVYNASWQLFGYYLVARKCRQYHIPYLVPIQDIYPETIFTGTRLPLIVQRIGKAVLLPLDKYYLRHARIIRTITNEMKDYLCRTRHLSGDSFLIVNNWQEDSDFSYTVPNNDSGIHFVYVGSINAHSNTDLIIKAFISAGIKDSHLTVYGGGDKKNDCIRIVQEAGVNNVEFSFVSRSEVPKVQSNANVLVLALPKDNGHFCLPSKLTSYMLSGRPVLASVDEDSATTRILNECDGGVTVPPDDIELLTEGFKCFAKKTKEQRVEMGERCRKYAMDNLTKDINLSKVVNSIVKAIE